MGRIGVAQDYFLKMLYHDEDILTEVTDDKEILDQSRPLEITPSSGPAGPERAEFGIERRILPPITLGRGGVLPHSGVGMGWVVSGTYIIWLSS